MCFWKSQFMRRCMRKLPAETGRHSGCLSLRRFYYLRWRVMFPRDVEIPESASKSSRRINFLSCLVSESQSARTLRAINHGSTAVVLEEKNNKEITFLSSPLLFSIIPNEWLMLLFDNSSIAFKLFNVLTIFRINPYLARIYALSYVASSSFPQK